MNHRLRLLLNSLLVLLGGTCVLHAEESRPTISEVIEKHGWDYELPLNGRFDDPLAQTVEAQHLEAFKSGKRHLPSGKNPSKKVAVYYLAARWKRNAALRRNALDKWPFSSVVTLQEADIVTDFAFLDVPPEPYNPVSEEDRQLFDKKLSELPTSNSIRPLDYLLCIPHDGEMLARLLLVMSGEGKWHSFDLAEATTTAVTPSLDSLAPLSTPIFLRLLVAHEGFLHRYFEDIVPELNRRKEEVLPLLSTKEPLVGGSYNTRHPMGTRFRRNNVDSMLNVILDPYLDHEVMIALATYEALYMPGVAGQLFAIDSPSPEQIALQQAVADRARELGEPIHLPTNVIELPNPSQLATDLWFVQQEARPIKNAMWYELQLWKRLLTKSQDPSVIKRLEALIERVESAPPIFEYESFKLSEASNQEQFVLPAGVKREHLTLFLAVLSRDQMVRVSIKLQELHKWVAPRILETGSFPEQVPPELLDDPLSDQPILYIPWKDVEQLKGTLPIAISPASIQPAVPDEDPYCSVLIQGNGRCRILYTPELADYLKQINEERETMGLPPVTLPKLERIRIDDRIRIEGE